MPESGRVDPISTLDGRAVAADFVENELPKYHPLFRHLSSRYASHPRAQAVPAPEPVTMPDGAPAPQQAAPGSRTQAGALSATEPPAEVKKTMEYWNKIFPEAMTEFTGKKDIKVPDNNPTYYIRDEKSWNAVYDKLQAARERYQNKHGFLGAMRGVWRWTADNATPTLALIPKLTPDIPIVTPVLGAVDVLLTAVKTASEVREKALQAFDGLPDLYSAVEIFLGASGENEDIKKKAISLVANLLVAIERAITFFISWAGEQFCISLTWRTGQLQTITSCSTTQETA
jgi:hypothetical protein